jgi:heat shock protein HtpX
VTDRSETFFDLQRRARRRSWLLLTGSFVILWLAANIVTSPGHLGESSCRTDPVTGEQTCTPTLELNVPLLLVTAGLAAAYIAIAYRVSGRAALALSGAKRADGPEYAALRNVVEEMSIASGTPVPSVWVVDDPSPNAFATGRDPKHAAVAVTTGLLRQLSRRELKGVIAHEIAHIRNRDIAVTTLAVLTAATIAVIADVAMRFAWLAARSGGRRGRGGAQGGVAIAAIAIAAALYLFALPAALLLRAALSRQRETLADVSAVQYTRDPTGIRSALEKLEADTSSPQRVSAATAHMWIDEPKPLGRPQVPILSRLFDTHPPIAERITVLRQLEGIDPAGRGPNDLPPPPAPLPGRTQP